ncbi:MAG: prepilin-type N-terminal cleavage/methylation domain-containing protein [candidate division Zixibacteria bacterium]|nr:prepilin-type N-terminal cleavage/methylation domain-containing protein [candidate division Zixibacteria bacterium]
MKKIHRKITKQSGFSILEVIIALVIMGVVTTAIFKLYISSHKNYMVQNEVVNVQQNARASIDEMARQIRMAGYDLPLGLKAVEASNANPDTITLCYRATNCDTYLASAMPQPSAELKCATDISCFYDGQWVYIFEPDSGGGEWFEISHVQSAAKHIQHNTMVLSKSYSADAIVMAINKVKFYIDENTDQNNPTLMIKTPGNSPQIFADYITDLQFKYRMKNGVVLDSILVSDNVREVQISVTGRSVNEDVDLDDFGDGDSFRRRTFSTSVFLRNVGI